MTEETRKAIETLGKQLDMHPWELNCGRIVCTSLEDTHEHGERTICPLAMAAYEQGDRMLELLQDPEHQEFTDWVASVHPGIREHLQAVNHHRTPEHAEDLERDATLHAAAAFVDTFPHNVVTQRILRMHENTIAALVDASDDPHSEAGRALIRALDPASEWLGAMYETYYGNPDAAE